MRYSERVALFKQVKAGYAGFLASVLWKLTADQDLFAEALQYALLGMWRNVEKLSGKKAGAYIYRIALSANSKAWRNRVGRNGQVSRAEVSGEKGPAEKVRIDELAQKIRHGIAQLPPKQARAITMRYLQQQSYETIAENLSCSEAGARSNVSKALSALKNKLAYLAEGAE